MCIRKWISLILLIYLISPALGQQSELGIRFGFQLSPTYTWMVNSSNKINKSGGNWGFRAGLISEYFFTENYAFISGIGFSFNQGGILIHESRGTYWAGSDIFPAPDTLPAGVKLGYSLRYLEIPLGLKMRTREFGYIRYFMEPHFIIGFRTQAQGQIEGPGIPDGLERIDIRGDVNSVNVSVCVGGGIEYAISGTTTFIAGLNLQFGFVDVSRNLSLAVDPGDGSSFRAENSKAVTNGVSLKLGIIF